MKARFKIELKKQIRFAIAAAIGFIIAYAWRDFILILTQKALGEFMTLNPTASSFAVAFTLTLIGVILIIISSKILE